LTGAIDMRLVRAFVGHLAFLSIVALPLEAAAQLAPPPPMQSGGLAPPPKDSGPPPPPPPQGGPTQLQLEQAGEKDSGRGLDFVYFEMEGGAQFASLEAITKSGTLIPPTSSSSGFGPLFGVSSGLRLLYFTVGPRFRFAHTNDWDLWTLNLDFGWRVPLGRVEPHGEMGAGFAKVGHSADKIADVYRDVSVTGFDIRLGGGVDYFPTNMFSIGVTVDADFMRLSRGRVVPLRSATGLDAFMSDASSLGLAVTGCAVVGFHF
jgi:hypothetical protein